MEAQSGDAQDPQSSRSRRIIFGHRTLILAVFALVTAVLGCDRGDRPAHRCESSTSSCRSSTSTSRPTSITRQDFGGANRVLIAVIARDGNMFTPEFFEALKIATDEVFFIDGIDRARVQSLFTPNVRYTEVVEDGIEAGNVIPSEFEPTPAGLARVRENILKAGIVGRLVANDFSGAMVSGAAAGRRSGNRRAG